MARKPRLHGKTGIYHVILRGNNRQNLFNDDSDRKFFLAKLKKYSAELNIDVHAYCLMNNHVHLLIGKANERMSLLIQKIANSYVFYFNRKYDRCGHLFQGRFKSEPINDDVYYKTVYRYILQNCEKAGLGKADRYRWNSFWAVRKSSDATYINVNHICGMFSSKNELLAFVLQKEKNKCMEYDNKIVFSDERAIRLIRKLFGIYSPYKLERLEIDEQISKCKILKKHGLSIPQIVRLTGISRFIAKKTSD